MKLHRILALLSVTAITSPIFSQFDYGLHFASFPDELSASRSAEDLSAKDSESSYWVYENASDSSYRVLLGRYDTYAEAWADGMNLELDATIFRFPEPESGRSLPISKQAQLRSRVFDTTNLDSPAASSGVSHVALGKSDIEQPSTDALSKPIESRNKEEQISVGFHAATNPIGAPALEKFISDYPDDERVSSARLRLARRYMGRKDFDGVSQQLNEVMRKGNPSEKGQAKVLMAYGTLYNPDKPASDTFLAFQQVANDQTLDSELREDAMIRAAASAHNAKMYPESLAAYSEIEKHHSSPTQRADATLKRIGLTFELVHQGEGSWDDVRSLISNYLDQDDIPSSMRATASLMNLESYYYERDHETCIAIGESFLDNMPEGEFLKQTATARLFIGLSQHYTGNTESAKSILEKVLELPLTDKDQWGGQISDLKERAVDILILIANETDDQKSTVKWTEYKTENFTEE